MAAGLISLHSERVALLTGTPFNNSLQDMATLMTYIKPSDKAAELKWWTKATEPRAARTVAGRLQEWTTRNMLRREKKIIEHLLPKKHAPRQEVINWACLTT